MSDPRIDRTVALIRAAAAAARLTVADLVRSEALDDDDVADVAALFPPWAAGQAVAAGDLRSWDGTVVECVQAHTTQADWTPDVTPALWKVHRQTAGPTPDPWVQPTGGHAAYQLGDRVTHNGQTWESTAADNVWAPGVYGWVVVA